MLKNRSGVVLISVFLVVIALSLLLGGIFLQSINENRLAVGAVSRKRAFWLAEAGIAQVLANPGLADTSGNDGNPKHAYTATVSGPLAGTSNYYQIDATGTVTLDSGEVYQDTVSVTVQTAVVDPSKFQYGIETTTDLVIKGSVDINPDDSKKEFSSLNFDNLFSVSKEDMQANAYHTYTESDFGEPVVEGITWVNVSSGSTLTVTGNLIGSGILVVNGDTRFSGTVVFHGIIYIIGELTMTGNVTTWGSVLAESDATVDTELKGNVTINYSLADIANALDVVKFLSKEVVSWRQP